MNLKEEFEKLIRADYATYAAFQKPRYLRLIQRLEEIYGNQRRKESGDYRLLKRFEICEINGEKRLIKRGTRDPVKVFVCTDELFEIIKAAHVNCGHGGETRTVRELNRNFANITREQVKAFVSLCQWCHGKACASFTSSKPGGFSVATLKTKPGRRATNKGKSSTLNVNRNMHRLSDSVDPIQQCEVLIKEEEADLNSGNELKEEYRFDDSISVEEIGMQSDHGEDSSSTNNDDVRNVNPPSHFHGEANLGAAVRQLVECQRELLLVETKRLAVEEARLQMEQQMASNLLELLSYFKVIPTLTAETSLAKP